MKPRWLVVNAGLVWVLAVVAIARAGAVENEKPAAAPQKYLRLERKPAGEPVSLQTAIVRFVPAEGAKEGVTVDLIGAVHVGEKAYYEQLNKRFEDYDVVLYELVAPEGTRIPKGAKPGGHPVAMLQNGLKDMLQLEHQLQYIDYTKDNLMHADMSPEDLSKAMSDRNESFLSLMFRMMGHAMAQQSAQANKGATSELDLITAFFDPDRAGTMKRLMAEQFENMEGIMARSTGPRVPRSLPTATRWRSRNWANRSPTARRRSRSSMAPAT